MSETECNADRRGFWRPQNPVQCTSALNSVNHKRIGDMACSQQRPDIEGAVVVVDTEQNYDNSHRQTRSSSPTPSLRTLKATIDLSQWHEVCRPVVVDLIQGLPTIGINKLIESRRLCEDYLTDALLRRFRDRREYQILTLPPRSEPQTHWLGNGFLIPYTHEPEPRRSFDVSSRASISSKSSASSSSSTTSIASQVSDSNLNDVQQSVELLLRLIDEAQARLKSLEKGRIASKIKHFLAAFPLQGEAKVLSLAMKALSEELRDSFPAMETIGFSTSFLLVTWLFPQLML